MDEDKKEEQKKANVDRSKLAADIKAQRDLASKVGIYNYNGMHERLCSVHDAVKVHNQVANLQ